MLLHGKKFYDHETEGVRTMASSILNHTCLGYGASSKFLVGSPPPSTSALSIRAAAASSSISHTVVSQTGSSALVSKRFSRLSPLLSDLLSASCEDIPRILEPWLSNLKAEDWNVLVADVGHRSWSSSLCIFDTFRQKSPVWQDLFQEMEETGESAPALLKISTTLVRLLAKKQRKEEIAHLQKQMKEDNILPDTAFYNALFTLHADCGQVDQISKGLLDMEEAGIKPDSLTYELFMTACLGEGAPDLKMLESLLQNMINKGMPANANVFQKLINGFWEAEDVEGAERVFASMQDAGHLPDSKIINKLMQLHGRQGNHERNLELFNLSKKLNLKHIQTAYGYLMHSYCKAGLLKKAKQAFKRFKKETGSKPTLVNFNMILDACGKQGFHEDVLEYYGDLCNSGLEVNIVSYCTVISAMVSVGKFEKAEQLYRRMLSNGIQPNLHIYLKMIHCYTECKATRLGREIYFAMRKARVKMTAMAYSTVLALYAATTLKRMVREGFELDTAAHGVLIRAFGNVSDDVVPLIQAVEASEFDLCKLLSSVSLTTKQGPKVGSDIQKLIGDYFDSVEASSKKLDALAIYNAFLDCLWQRGLKGTAQILLEKARQKSAAGSCPKMNATNWTLDVRGLSVGGSKVAVAQWLGQVEGIWESSAHHTKMIIITGIGDLAHMVANEEVGLQKRGLKGALLYSLRALASPFVQSTENPTMLEASKPDVVNWVKSGALEKGMRLVDCV